MMVRGSTGVGLLWTVLSCGPRAGNVDTDTDTDTGATAPLACPVVVDEQVAAGEIGYDMAIAVADDGALHALWQVDGAIHAARRTGAAQWQRVDGPLAAIAADAVQQVA